MKIQVAGKELDATPIPFTGSGEMAHSLLLDDGTVLRVKVVITEVLRLEGQTDALGRPAYILQSATLIVPA